jgi:hypothetical protein
MGRCAYAKFDLLYPNRPDTFVLIPDWNAAPDREPSEEIQKGVVPPSPAGTIDGHGYELVKMENSQK